MKLYLFILGTLIAALGLGGFLYITDRSLRQGNQTEADADMVGGDRDAHGCIGSAGYSWCEAKGTCIRSWEEPCEVVDEDELIKQALYVKNGWEEGAVTVTVSENDGTYAKGMVNSQGGGGYFFAAKKAGSWQIVADGNGIIDCATLTEYSDYPTTLIPQCYDYEKDVLVTR
jgi:hypothetical protein